MSHSFIERQKRESRSDLPLPPSCPAVGLHGFGILVGGGSLLGVFRRLAFLWFLDTSILHRQGGNLHETTDKGQLGDIRVHVGASEAIIDPDTAIDLQVAGATMFAVLAVLLLRAPNSVEAENEPRSACGEQRARRRTSATYASLICRPDRPRPYLPFLHSVKESKSVTVAIQDQRSPEQARVMVVPKMAVHRLSFNTP